MRMIRVAVVEDQTMLRDSLVSAINRELDMEVVASLADAADVLDLAPDCEVDVALLDVCTEHNLERHHCREKAQGGSSSG